MAARKRGSRARRAKPGTALARLRKALALLTVGAEADLLGPRAAASVAVRRDARRWMRGAAVQGLGIGYRTASGRKKRELTLKVYVDRKLPLDKLRAPAPRWLRFPGIGKVPVDVQEIGRLAPEIGMARERPAAPGAGVGPVDGRLGTGTLGCLVRKRGDANNLFLLSNAHVIARDGLAPYGAAVLQPSGEFGGREPADVLARLEKSVDIAYSKQGYYNLADAAIARVVDPQDVTARIAAGIGVPRGHNFALRPGMRVRIAGAKSGYSTGEIIDLDFFWDALYEFAPGDKRRAGFRNQVLCTRYSAGGDSGAAVLDDQGRVVGLHVGGSTDGATGIERSVFTPIAQVLESLQVELVTQASPALLSTPPVAAAIPGWLAQALPELCEVNRFGASVAWRLTPDGLEVDGTIEATQGAPLTVGRVWERFGASIVGWCDHFRVPVELVVATICTESSGNPFAAREEPGFTSDAATPSKVSAGLMQTLLSTAREALGNGGIDRPWLFVPDHSVQAGSAYIDAQRAVTRLDPPRVACAYNAGGLYANNSAANRWRMRQYPKNSAEHADRFVRWFNDCFRYFGEQGGAPASSFFAALRN